MFLECGRPRFDPLVGKIPWRRMATDSSTLAWRIPWRSLVGYSPWGHKESDTTERRHFHFSFLSIRVPIYPHMGYFYMAIVCVLGFPDSSVSKESTCSAGDPGSIPGSGRSPGEENGNPLQYSCLENSMDRGT